MVSKTLTALLLLLLATPQRSAALTYAAYHLWAQGGARIISLGGAFAAIENDASSIWISPAMIPLTNSGLDVVLTQGQAFSSEFQPQSSISSETTFISTFGSTSLSYVQNKAWSIAAGDGEPFSEGPGNPVFASSLLSIHETRLSFGANILDNVSLAALGVFRYVREKYSGYLDAFSEPTGFEQSATAVNFGLSAAWRINDLWMSSLSWEEPSTFNLNNPSYLTALGNGIQPAKIPSITRFGLTRRWASIKLLLSGQVDLWTDTAGLSAFIDSQYQGRQTASQNGTIVVPRGGAEYMIIDRTWVRSWIRGGFYVEQPRVQQNRAREHWTLGVESKLWILDFNFAFDHASGFANAATSVGLSLSDYL